MCWFDSCNPCQQLSDLDGLLRVADADKLLNRLDRGQGLGLGGAEVEAVDERTEATKLYSL